MNMTTHVVLDFERETKRTCLYKTTNPSAPIQNIYVRKEALGNTFPNQIEVTVKAVTEED